MTEQEPLKIVIPVEEEPPLKAERKPVDARDTAAAAGQKLAGLAQQAAHRAWNSETGRKVGRKLQETADQGVRYVGTRVADAAEEQARQKAATVQERLKETDWQQETRQGVSAGLKWLSGQLAEVAGRLLPDETPEDDRDQVKK